MDADPTASMDVTLVTGRTSVSYKSITSTSVHLVNCYKPKDSGCSDEEWQ